MKYKQINKPQVSQKTTYICVSGPFDKQKIRLYGRSTFTFKCKGMNGYYVEDPNNDLFWVEL